MTDRTVQLGVANGGGGTDTITALVPLPGGIDDPLGSRKGRVPLAFELAGFGQELAVGIRRRLSVISFGVGGVGPGVGVDLGTGGVARIGLGGRLGRGLASYPLIV